jgi:hypothetical protein
MKSSTFFIGMLMSIKKELSLIPSLIEGKERWFVLSQDFKLWKELSHFVIL